MPQIRCANAPRPASLFIQLSMRRHAVSPLPVLVDLLVPSRTRSPLTPYRAFTTPTTHPSARRHTAAGARRAFSSSPTTRTTHAIFNPQRDADGNEMMLEMTARAAKRLSEIMAKDANPYLALRIQVESGGCHGFQYLMKLVTLPATLPETGASEEEDPDAPVREDDTIFTFAADDGPAPTADAAGPKIILDSPSLDLLKGSKVDFTMELIGSQFKIVDNPLATSSCGCGTSFDIKM
ncbi:iron-sulfur cluster assembly accessory protein [Lasiosphaeris hirsuta]|uniref:Iron-sulfur cluster assembly accessory protein n=1 Tax=Lasiosphaeris hirsuta TaxID=260670 RepID=A0AA40A9C6_9PEZI|nr:iron-sulfur cluster assembly accessory protein [Lasiosphaeris hirsuta]